MNPPKLIGKFLPSLAASVLMFLPALLTAAGFADGVKIGEVTDTTAIIWTRLTARAEADNQVPEWTEGANPMQWSVPGEAGSITLTVQDANGKSVGSPLVGSAEADNDFCHQFKLQGLKPDSRYQFHVTDASGKASFAGSFRTAPTVDSNESITFVVSTCQDFPRRDDLVNGHKIYHSMLQQSPRFFVQTGDAVYYDHGAPYAKNIAMARYLWNQIYSTPNFVRFHSQVPSYWMHDDHDLLKNDCWPGQTYGDLTWEQGFKVWHEQTPQTGEPYRTYRWGHNVQVWFPEGRAFRSPNDLPDGPDKTILGATQWKWLEDSMRASTATFKFLVSETPVVGPDRKNKKDNHANEGFYYEGERLRHLLASIPGCIVINGDRHWQYHSVDTETGLNEFSSGPASDKHAEGWKQENVLPEHRFLRVKGGYISAEVTADKAIMRHHDVDGKEVYSVTLPAPKH